MDTLIKITTLEEFEKASHSSNAMMVFSTTWCPDCHFLKTYIADLVEDNKEWTFYYIDRDELVDLCIDLEIMGIPSFVAYDNGNEVGRFVNKLRKTREEVQEFINNLK